jgi:small-conductance mechanosensitive channel
MDIKIKSDKQQLFADAESNKPTLHHKIWIGSYLFLALISLTVYLLLYWNVLSEILGTTYFKLLKKISLGVFFGSLVLMFSRIIERIVTRREHMVFERYNLMRMIRLLSWMVVLAIIISFLFHNWYSAAVSLGLISLILGFALQTPISSFIGWLYIIFREPYLVGDRIQIDTFRGDVVEINYLDTTLWEFSGDYLSNDLPSGRLIRFPNTLILQSAVHNYSWEKFPYIWNEIPFHVAYESDLKFVEETIKRITTEELGQEMAANVLRYKDLVEQTPIDQLKTEEYPFVSFRINANTWVEVDVTYLVEPKNATSVRSRLVKKILEVLNQAPDKVMFPKSSAR